MVFHIEKFLNFIQRLFVMLCAERDAFLKLSMYVCESVQILTFADSGDTSSAVRIVRASGRDEEGQFVMLHWKVNCVTVLAVKVQALPIRIVFFPKLTREPSV